MEKRDDILQNKEAGPSFKAKRATVLVEVSATVSNRLTSISQFPFFYERSHTHTHTHPSLYLWIVPGTAKLAVTLFTTVNSFISEFSYQTYHHGDSL